MVGLPMYDQQQLLYLSGIGSDYLDYSGQLRSIDQRDRLRALRVTTPLLGDPQAVKERIFQLDAAPWQRLLRPFIPPTASTRRSAFTVRRSSSVPSCVGRFTALAGQLWPARYSRPTARKPVTTISVAFATLPAASICPCWIRDCIRSVWLELPALKRC